MLSKYHLNIVLIQVLEDFPHIGSGLGALVPVTISSQESQDTATPGAGMKGATN